MALAMVAGACVAVPAWGHAAAAGEMTAPIPAAGPTRDRAITGIAAERFAPAPGIRELTGMLLVQPAAGASAQAMDRAIEARGGETLGHVSEIEQRIVRVPADRTDLQFARELAATGLFRTVEPNWLLYPASAPPNDPMAGQQWHLPRIGAFDAWDLVDSNDDWVVVAFVDTGIDTDHPDLDGQFVPGYNSNFRATQQQGAPVTDVNGHGTVVAGVAAAITNNDLGVAGVSWNVGIMPIRASNLANGAAFASDINDGIIWAVQSGARVVNVGFDGVESSSNESLGQFARANGALLVWPIGNGTVYKDFDHPSVTVVSGTDRDDLLAADSSFGPGVDLAAPSVAIRSTRNDGQFGSQSGTSFAAPIVSGVAALLWLADPDQTPDQVEAILLASADDIGDPGRDDSYGFGVVDSLAAVRTIVGTDPFADPDGTGTAADGLSDECSNLRIGDPPIGFDRSRPLLQGLSARYFNYGSPAADLNDLASLDPIAVNLEHAISFRPEPGQPFGRSGLIGSLGAEFIGELHPPAAGLYRIRINASGIARVQIDGACVAYTSSLDTESSVVSRWLFLEDRPHDLRIEYASGSDQPTLEVVLTGNGLDGPLRGNRIGVRKRLADMDANGYINEFDLLLFVDNFTQGQSDADVNGDGEINDKDYHAFLDAYVADLGT